MNESRGTGTGGEQPGDPRGAIADRLFASAYRELRRIARHEMARERDDHTLQPTAVINEVYLRLANAEALEGCDRAGFIAIATRAMRQVLVDHARAHGRSKRGGGWRRVVVDEEMATPPETDVATIDLARALDRLRQLNVRIARVVELRILGGLTGNEIARLCGVSRKTVSGDWRFAKRWLRSQLSEANE